jgi:Xaa-Pro aminopeptidase
MARGKIYWHGTSHGIGHNLCVHEGPQSVRMEENSVSLALGMVLSNEPAVYIVGEYGIRIENTIVVTPWMKNEFAEFYQFETLNVLPINTEPINYDMLDEPHKQWLEEYNSRCL